MKRLLLVMGMVGCGGGGPHPFEQLGAWIERNEQGEAVYVRLNTIKISDAGLVHLKELTTLHALWLRDTQVTDAGLPGSDLKGHGRPHNRRQKSTNCVCHGGCRTALRSLP